jgi:EAL domain-containing protein (putative c-di-GMP-specific phosphodiesterase class I)/GGDEF domain-containing protein
MYIPILLAALFFRMPGGIVAAVIAGLALGPHMPIDVAAGEMQTTANWLYRLGIFVVVGALTGFGVQLWDRHIRQFRWLAYHDIDTGLPNRVFMAAALEDLIRRQRGNGEIAVMVLQLANYSQITGTFGLSSVEPIAEQFSEHIRPVVGDPPLCQILPSVFGVIAPLNQGKADIIPQLLAATQQPVHLDGLPVLTDVAAGLARYPEHGTDAATLIRKASVACLAAQDKGMRLVAYSEVDDGTRRAKLQLLGALPGALAHDQLRCHYQPIVLMSTCEPVMVEALLRWEHPERGRIPPAVFIPLAEQTSLVSPLNDFTLGTSMREFSTWVSRPRGLRLAVNISARLLYDASWLHSVEQHRSRNNLTPGDLVFEITESAAMADIEGALRTMEQIRDMGIEMAIDDFGTGSSSLSYLKQLPVHHIKIDNSFISRLPYDEQDQQIVRAAITLGHNLGLQVVAEGVETEQVYTWLLDNECDMAQGFWMSRPLPASELAPWFAGNRGYCPPAPAR